jgi:hypothetical protein
MNAPTSRTSPNWISSIWKSMHVTQHLPPRDIACQPVAVEGTQYNNILLSTLVVEFMEELSGFFGSKLNYSTYGSGSVCYILSEWNADKDLHTRFKAGLQPYACSVNRFVSESRG